MAENQQVTELVRQEVAPKNILDHPLVKEFGIPLAKQALKKELGIGTEHKVNNKSPFGRTIATLKDFIQGTFWVFLISAITLMLTFVFYLWLRKALGV